MLRRMGMRRSALLCGTTVLLLVAGCGQAQERLQPVGYSMSAQGNLVIIYFPWEAAGACIDQFEGTVEETGTTVTIGAVVHTPFGGDCSDVSTDGNTLSVAEPLSAPLGERSVVTQDGQPLPRR